MCEFWNSLECLGGDPNPALPVSDTDDWLMKKKLGLLVSHYKVSPSALQLTDFCNC